MSCRNAAETCCRADCLRFLSERERSFAAYRGRRVQLAGVATCGGCDRDPALDENFQKQLDKLKRAGVTEVHVSACVTSERRACPHKAQMFSQLAEAGFEIRRIEERPQ